MTRHEEIRPVLESWVDERPAAIRDDDLLAQVMTAVEAIPQRTTGWQLNRSSLMSWMPVVAVVLILVAPIGLYVAGQSGRKTIVPAPTATPTPWQTDVAPDDLVEALMQAWNGNGVHPLGSFYASDAQLLVVTEQVSSQPGVRDEESTTLQGPDAIAAFVAGRQSSLWGTSAVLQRGPYLAVMLWDGHASADSLAWVLELRRDKRIGRQWLFSVADDGMFGWDGPPGADGYANDEIVAALDAELAAINDHDGAAHAAFFTPEGTWRLAVGVSYWKEEYVGRGAIAETTTARAQIDFHVTRTGPVLDAGSLVLYPWTMTGSLGDAEGFAVLLEGGDYQQKASWIASQWVVGEPGVDGAAASPVPAMTPSASGPAPRP